MRIAYFSDDFYPMISGIADTILITGRTLKNRGHEICYVAPRYSKHTYEITNRAYPQDPEREEVDGMRVARLPSVHLPMSPTGESRFAFSTGGSYAFLQEFKPDIIHIQSPYSLGAEARKMAKHFNVPLVGTNHTAIEDFFPPGTRAAMRRFDAWYYNHCDVISAPYQRLIDRMREVGFIKPGFAVANPAELSEFSPPESADRDERRRALGLEGPMLLAVGRLANEKRVDVTIRAMPRLVTAFPTLTLMLTGHGAAEESLKKLAQQLGVAKHVRFLGFLSRKALSHVYKAADAYVMMSTSDSQSLALMQGYATGVPAFCARARGLPDFTPADCGFLIEPGNHEELASKIELFLKDEALRTKMGAAAIAYSKNFAPEKIAQQWEEVYTNVIRAKQ
jgi:1,2-diacylglycerol 3-alpha-glucosyltransferase